MNALVVHQPAQHSMNDVERMALAIARGGLFGSTDANAVLTLCLLAQAEGKHPGLIMQDYHIIKGKPAKKAEAMLRDFIASGGSVEWHALSDECADATFSHPQGGTVRIDWTLKRARQAGISTPMWQKYPRQMLRSRVVSEGVRSVCPSATSGMYETDEVRDIVGETIPAKEAQVGGGDNAESTVSPAADTLRTQLEQSVEAHSDDTAFTPIATDRSVRPKDDGPNKSALDAIENRIVHELNGCGDEDSLICYLETPEYKADKAVLDEYRPSALYGPAPDECPEYLPIKAKIKGMVDEFRNRVPAEEPNIMQAG